MVFQTIKIAQTGSHSMALSLYHYGGYYVLYHTQKKMDYKQYKTLKFGSYSMALSLYYYREYYVLFQTQKKMVLQTIKNSSNWFLFNGSIIIILS